MPVVASIAFKQGATVGAPGYALIGTDGTAVTVSNGNDAAVENWLFEVVDAPPTSAVPRGVIQNGTLPTYTFTPDVPGGYEFHLVVTDQFGNFAEDFRVFQVAEPSGRYITSFKATDLALNFTIPPATSPNARGWAPLMEAYLRTVDNLVTGALSAVPTRVTAISTSVGMGDYCIACNPAGPITVTAPASPSLGRAFQVVDANGSSVTNNITINGNGKNINGSASFVISKAYAAYTLTYTGVEWSVTAMYELSTGGGGGDTGTYTLGGGVVLKSIVYLSSSDTVSQADASSSATAPAIGIVTAIAGPSCTVQTEGEYSGFSGLTPGAIYYLSTTAGGITATPPSSTGQILQKVGIAKDATTLVMEFDPQFIAL